VELHGLKAELMNGLRGEVAVDFTFDSANPDNSRVTVKLYNKTVSVRPANLRCAPTHPHPPPPPPTHWPFALRPPCALLLSCLHNAVVCARSPIVLSRAGMRSEASILSLAARRQIGISSVRSAQMSTAIGGCLSQCGKRATLSRTVQLNIFRDGMMISAFEGVAWHRSRHWPVALHWIVVLAQPCLRSIAYGQKTHSTHPVIRSGETLLLFSEFIGLHWLCHGICRIPLFILARRSAAFSIARRRALEDTHSV
jgi:hypothetical protein